MNEKYQRLYELILASPKITLFTHIYRDGDAVGSLIGFKDALKTTFPDKEIYAISGEVDKYNTLFSDFDTVSDEVIDDSLAIILDVGNGARVSDQRFILARESFLIDHHIYSETYTSDALIDNDKIATAEIVSDFIFTYNFKLTEVGATALLLGIITDSGRFTYEPTSALTLHLASLLMQNGAQLQKINDFLSMRKLDQVRFRGYLLSNFKIDRNVCYAVVTTELLHQFNLDFFTVGSIVNQIGNIEGYPAWVTFLEKEPDQIFVELRSKGVNVQEVAVKFGGGGHLQASGCRIDTFDKVQDVLDALNNQVTKDE